MNLLSILFAVALSAGGWFTIDDFSRDDLGTYAGFLPLGRETGAPWDGGNSLLRGTSSGPGGWSMTTASSIITISGAVGGETAQGFNMYAAAPESGGEALGNFAAENAWSYLKPFEVMFRIRYTESGPTAQSARNHISIEWVDGLQDRERLARARLHLPNDGLALPSTSSPSPLGGLTCPNASAVKTRPGFGSAVVPIPEGEWLRWQLSFEPVIDYDAFPTYQGTRTKSKVWAESASEPDWQCEGYFEYGDPSEDASSETIWYFAYTTYLSPISNATTLEIDWIKGRWPATPGHTVIDEFTGNGSATTFYLQEFQQIRKVTVDGISTDVTESTPFITFDRAPSSGAVIEVTYIAS